jgi:hypothetical protein
MFVINELVLGLALLLGLRSPPAERRRGHGHPAVQQCCHDPNVRRHPSADDRNPSVAVAAPATDWAHGPAQADIAALHNPALQPAGAPPSSVATVISLVQLAQQQAQASDVAVQQLQSDLEQLSDCGLGVPPAP